MNPDTTTHDVRRRARVHTILALMILLIGVVLLIYMIRVESEPGALPLLLIVIGVGWYVVTRVRLSRLG